jgi:membrane associated rhomboid family serine protease
MKGAFFLLLNVTIALVLVIKLFPRPKSLKDGEVNLWTKIVRRKSSISIILGLSLIHLLATSFSFGTLSDEFTQRWGFYFDWDTHQFNWSGLLISSFLHHNSIHLLSNTVGLAFLASYEDRVNQVNFHKIIGLGVLGGYLSPFSLLGVPSVGFSGALYGLLAAIILEYSEKRNKDFILAFVTVFVFILYSIFEASRKSNGGLIVDHFAHLGGAITVIVYLWISNRNKSSQHTEKSNLQKIS